MKLIFHFVIIDLIFEINPFQNFVLILFFCTYTYTFLHSLVHKIIGELWRF